MLSRIFDIWSMYKNTDLSLKMTDAKYSPKQSQRIKNKIKRKRNKK